MGWDGMGWDGMGWDGMGWDGMGWDGMGWDGMGWDGMGWDGIGWDGMGWDGMGWVLDFIYTQIRQREVQGDYLRISVLAHLVTKLCDRNIKFRFSVL
jgi:hypothetical protein